MFAQESEAVKLELEAEYYESNGYPNAAEEKRIKAAQIRRKDFQFRKDYETPVSDVHKTRPFDSGNVSFWGGFWEIGIRGNRSFAAFGGGEDWQDKNARLWFQSGSPFFPRSSIPYQNESVLPLTDEPKSFSSRQIVPSITLSYRRENQKWGIEYSNLPFQTSYTHNTFGLINGFQTAQYETRFRMLDHRLVLKIYEEFRKDKWFSWDFGIRTGGWRTDSAYYSSTLNQAGAIRENVSFVAPSAGMRYYQSFPLGMRLELGADIFLTPFGTLDYKRTVLKDPMYGAEGAISGLNQYYSIESGRPLQMNLSGFDFHFVYSFLFLKQHRLNFGFQSTSYTWKANESQMPRFTAVNVDSLGAGVMDWYKSSAIYEADGTGKRTSRYFSVLNLYFGYSYAF
ncbi:hypothetical protein [Leptospira idonii]|uniref:Uncharacterized protein n=1 Tax=Leptospira idonii TaxID=1193500 RepID=A0A4R9M2V8_9LEPT|nr:hypothetical protein [Leptospira idonii]TGN19629.1 hypothetical protein EHS15_07545 [Leptospira idonii]